MSVASSLSFACTLDAGLKLAVTEEALSYACLCTGQSPVPFLQLRQWRQKCHAQEHSNGRHSQGRDRASADGSADASTVSGHAAPLLQATRSWGAAGQRSAVRGNVQQRRAAAFCETLEVTLEALRGQLQQAEADPQREVVAALISVGPSAQCPKQTLLLTFDGGRSPGGCVLVEGGPGGDSGRGEAVLRAAIGGGTAAGLRMHADAGHCAARGGSSGTTASGAADASATDPEREAVILPVVALACRPLRGPSVAAADVDALNARHRMAPDAACKAAIVSVVEGCTVDITVRNVRADEIELSASPDVVGGAATNGAPTSPPPHKRQRTQTGPSDNFVACAGSGRSAAMDVSPAPTRTHAVAALEPPSAAAGPSHTLGLLPTLPVTAPAAPHGEATAATGAPFAAAAPAPHGRMHSVQSGAPHPLEGAVRRKIVRLFVSQGWEALRLDAVGGRSALPLSKVWLSLLVSSAGPGTAPSVPATPVSSCGDSDVAAGVDSVTHGGSSGSALLSSPADARVPIDTFEPSWHSSESAAAASQHIAADCSPPWSAFGLPQRSQAGSYLAGAAALAASVVFRPLQPGFGKAATSSALRRGLQALLQCRMQDLTVGDGGCGSVRGPCMPPAASCGIGAASSASAPPDHDIFSVEAGISAAPTSVGGASVGRFGQRVWRPRRDARSMDALGLVPAGHVDGATAAAGLPLGASSCDGALASYASGLSAAGPMPFGFVRDSYSVPPLAPATCPVCATLATDAAAPVAGAAAGRGRGRGASRAAVPSLAIAGAGRFGTTQRFVPVTRRPERLTVLRIVSRPVELAMRTDTAAEPRSSVGVVTAPHFLPLLQVVQLGLEGYAGLHWLHASRPLVGFHADVAL